MTRVPLLRGRRPGRLREALLACAVDPAIGGVLLRGEKGTAKTTAVRGLAPLLGEGALVELPLGATEDRVLGTLDLGRALREGEAAFQPGLLAAAHGGCSTSTRSTCCPTTWSTCCSTPPRSAASTSSATGSRPPTPRASCSSAR